MLPLMPTFLSINSTVQYKFLATPSLSPDLSSRSIVNNPGAEGIAIAVAIAIADEYLLPVKTVWNPAISIKSNIQDTK